MSLLNGSAPVLRHSLYLTPKALPTEANAESGTSKSKSGASVNLSDSGKHPTTKIATKKKCSFKQNRQQPEVAEMGFCTCCEFYWKMGVPSVVILGGSTCRNFHTTKRIDVIAIC